MGHCVSEGMEYCMATSDLTKGPWRWLAGLDEIWIIILIIWGVHREGMNQLFFSCRRSVKITNSLPNSDALQVCHKFSICELQTPSGTSHSCTSISYRLTIFRHGKTIRLEEKKSHFWWGEGIVIFFSRLGYSTASRLLKGLHCSKHRKADKLSGHFIHWSKNEGHLWEKILIAQSRGPQGLSTGYILELLIVFKCQASDIDRNKCAR